jgi:molybdate transport system substrate-binding protein
MQMADQPAHVHVLISGGLSFAYEQLLPEFKRATGIDVSTGSGASQGSGPQTIPVSEILHAPGVAFAGSIAPEIQFVQVFSAAVVAGSREPENAKRLIAFLATARAAEAIRNSGMEPIAGSTR